MVFPLVSSLVVMAGRYPGDVFKVGRNRTLWATCLPNPVIQCVRVATVRVSDLPRRITPKNSLWPQILRSKLLMSSLTSCLARRVFLVAASMFRFDGLRIR